MRAAGSLAKPLACVPIALFSSGRGISNYSAAKTLRYFTWSPRLSLSTAVAESFETTTVSTENFQTTPAISIVEKIRKVEEKSLKNKMSHKSRENIKKQNKSSPNPNPNPNPAPTPSPSAACEKEVNKNKTVRKSMDDIGWSNKDKKIVDDSIKDSESRSKRQNVDEHGFVLLSKRQEDLEAFVSAFGEPKYRAQQIQKSVIQGAKSINEITTISKEFREKMEASGVKIGRSAIHSVKKSPDGTTKFLLQLRDGRVIESVGIPADRATSARLTACISSQVGCPLKCSFCATGKGGFSRNLDAYEIVDQVLTIQEQMQRRVTHVVFMGMGEPLLNLRQVVDAQEVLNKQVGIGARYITISTVGVPNAIRNLASYKLQSTLAVSLHAPNQQLRESIVPSAKAYPLEHLLKDCRMYFKSTGRRVTFEYTLLEGINDSEEQARELCNLLESNYLRTHVNLLQWNPVKDMDYKRPSRNKAEAFKKILEQNLFPVTVRKSRGLEEMAACGQLSNSNQKNPLQNFQTLK